MTPKTVEQLTQELKAEQAKNARLRVALGEYVEREKVFLPQLMRQLERLEKQLQGGKV